MTGQFWDIPRRLTSAPVVVGVDGSDAARAALLWAARVALDRERELCIAYGLDLDSARRVFNCYDISEPAVLQRVRAHGLEVAAREALAVRETLPELRVSTEISSEHPARMLARHSATAYLTAVGPHGTGGFTGHLGSVALSVAARAEGPIVVVRADSGAPDGPRSSGPVVVGIDGGPVSEAAVATAFEEASERDAELVAVHAWSDLTFGSFAGDPYTWFPTSEIEVNEEAILAERLAGWQEKYPDVRVRRHITIADPGPHLRQWSDIAQLIVVGSHGRGGFRGLLLGSVSNSLVQHANCPVMVVRPGRGPSDRDYS
ncbi:universal stress protein [Nocardia spumae]|uniref:universal stress protein n=1 Tax=Nocardia spumae TaxID=2887190 RepID=UPI001D13F07F|nr:universal stress protein [Nocardia spumae]